MVRRNTAVIFLSDFSGGVNKHTDAGFTPMLLAEKQLLASKNIYWQNGLKKRKGTAKYVSEAVVASTSVRGLHKFYRRSGASQLLAMSGTQIYEYVTGTGWVSRKTGLTTGLHTFFTTYGPTEKVFIANGTDTPMIWDGTAMSDYAAAPAGAKQFIVQRGRVFAFAGDLTISYSDNLDPNTYGVGNDFTLTTADPVITAGAKHTQAVSTESIMSELLFFTDNTTWILSGSDYTNMSDVILQEISGTVGTSSPKTVIQTPAGTIFFGRQQGRNNVFLVSGEGLNARIIPIGDNIRQVLNEISYTDMANMSAIYADGYYRIWFKGLSDTNNEQEWWLSVDSLQADRIAWYGPMRRGISAATGTVLSGAADNNEIIAGGDDGYVYRLDTGGNDLGVSIPVEMQIRYIDMDVPDKKKWVRKVFLTAQTTGGDVVVTIYSDVNTSVSLTMPMADAAELFPYTFPFTFPVPSIRTNVLAFSAQRIKSVDLSLKVAFDELEYDFFLNRIGIEYSVADDSIKEN